MKKIFHALFVILIFAAGILDCQKSFSSDSQFKIVANSSNERTSVDRRFLARVFLKKVAYWDDGTAAIPVDLPFDSPIRQEFTKEVLGRSKMAVRNYLQQLIFSGRGVPPIELKNDDQVIHYISAHEGAVGYVSADAQVGSLRVLDLK